MVQLESRSWCLDCGWQRGPVPAGDDKAIRAINREAEWHADDHAHGTMTDTRHRDDMTPTPHVLPRHRGPTAPERATAPSGGEKEDQ